MSIDDSNPQYREVARFNEVLDTMKTTKMDFVAFWNDLYGVIMVRRNSGEIVIVHGVKNIGGTFDTRVIRVVGHVGVGSMMAYAGFVDHDVESILIKCLLPSKAERGTHVELPTISTICLYPK
jgi:hypothetical protein